MKPLFSWIQSGWVAPIVFAAAAVFLQVNPGPSGQRKTVVIELFTSEGCSSCPPADALLTRLGHALPPNGTEVIALGFHVDYWNHLGWQDRFSSHSYTARQEEYASKFHQGPYTPQLIVNGESELVGNDSRGAETAIARATARQEQAQVKLSWQSPDKLLVVATADHASSAQVLLAITEDDLSSNVARGENGGHVLHHSAVVRDLRVLGQLRHGRFEAQVPVKLSSGWKVKDLRLVAFVQPAPVGPVEGAAAIPFPNTR
jgi:hypothetical protein